MAIHLEGPGFAQIHVPLAPSDHLGLSSHGTFIWHLQTVPGYIFYRAQGTLRKDALYLSVHLFVFCSLLHWELHDDKDFIFVHLAHNFTEFNNTRWRYYSCLELGYYTSLRLRLHGRGARVWDLQPTVLSTLSLSLLLHYIKFYTF